MFIHAEGLVLDDGLSICGRAHIHMDVGLLIWICLHGFLGSRVRKALMQKVLVLKELESNELQLLQTSQVLHGVVVEPELRVVLLQILVVVDLNVQAASHPSGCPAASCQQLIEGFSHLQDLGTIVQCQRLLSPGARRL